MQDELEQQFAAYAATAGPELRRTAYLMCGDWHRAEDAAQDALVRLYGAWPRISRGSGLRTYARRTVVSTVLDQAKRPWRRERSVDHASLEPVGVPDGAGGHAERDHVMRALDRVPARQRACVVLRYYDDLSVTAVAEVLGVSEGTVKSQTARGLDALRTALEQLDPTGDAHLGRRTA